MSRLTPLFAMETLSGLSRGGYLVCIGWTTLVVTDDVSRVGQVFIVAMLTMLVGGPFVGAFVDRKNRKHLVIAAHLGIAGTMIVLGGIWLAQAEPGVTLLFLAVFAISALRLMHNAAHDGLIQIAAGDRNLVQIVARFRSVHLIATVIGTVLAGYVIDRISPAAGMYATALASILLVAPMMLVTGGRIEGKSPGLRAFLKDAKGGAEIFMSDRRLRLLALLAGISLPVGQLSNAILSSLIRDDLGRGSDAFAIVDAAWPAGGMIAALVLSLGIGVLSARNMEYVFAALAGLSTIALGFATSLPLLILAHGAMGLTVWLCRIVIDGRVLELCREDTVGRTKTGIEMAFSFSALIMCLSPTLVSLPQTSGYFLFWGALTTFLSLLIWRLNASN